MPKSVPGTSAATLAYGCVFCQAGKETFVAQYMQEHNPCMQATAVCQTKRFTRMGKTTLQNEVMLRGYVLFQTRGCQCASVALPPDIIVHLLTYSDGHWQMYGDDERYAQWVFRHNGLIGLSQARKIGNSIHIIKGPLKDMEARITRIDSRNRNGQVTITMGGRTLTFWLGFYLAEDIAEDARSLDAGLA